MIKGLIFDDFTGTPLKETEVTLFNIMNEKVRDIYPLPDGTFSLDIDFDENIYKIITFKDGYHFAYTLLDKTPKIAEFPLKIALRKSNR
ncbi:hypothetical protein FEE95_09625 [Maribacter algarum]|uniref:Carboxypeptidase regulatory-like domain-containing protein n=1 Tax=Maribacter algarum (ex Zhang et al. 2020) TaxID=2578118 RepID=A0A5S3PQ07_9FLAO|nr:hypothetical protein [Maribacter algarum]TMM56751.1 hypothetical protein FEE95_09625 [Maribacter algarum]